jgi:hypothetical protein
MEAWNVVFGGRRNGQGKEKADKLVKEAPIDREVFTTQYGITVWERDLIALDELSDGSVKTL